MYKKCFAVILVCTLFVSCKKDSEEVYKKEFDSNIESLPINQIQTIGSHNSYRIRTDQDLFEALEVITSILPGDLNSSSWDYTHIPIKDQLELGIRSLELDIYYDPTGGRFSKRLGNTLVGRDVESGVAELDEPGFKMLHIPDVDYNTHHYTFKSALRAIKEFSDNNPTHLPIILLIELKDFGIGNVLPIFTKILPFNQEAIDAIDPEIIEVFGENSPQIFKPDDLRGDNPNVFETIQKEGWPMVKDMRGKIIFVAFEEELYTKNNPNLEGRMMFQFAELESPNAAFVQVDGSAELVRIKRAVEGGAFVRTRADSDPGFAKSGRTNKRENAFKSGAQIISTDYYIPDYRAGQEGWSDYKVVFNGDNYARVNVLNAPDNLKGKLLPE